MLLPLGLGILLAIISVVGFFLNGYILLVLILAKQITPNNILLIHLSITQTLLSLIFLVFSFPPIVQNGIWISSIQFTCELNGFFLTLLHPISLWTICGLNCDRYYAIAAPLHYSAIVTNKKVFTGLVSGWIVIFLLSIPPFFKVAPFTFSTYMVACIPNFATNNSLWYAIVFTFVTLIIPGIVIIGCNIKVLMIARYHRHRIAAAIYEVTLSAQVTITHQRNPFFVPTVTAPSAGGPKFRSRSPISSVLHLVGSFIILYLPYYISIMWDSVLIQLYNGNLSDVSVNIIKTNQYILLVAQCFLTISTIINAILYGLKSKIIRKTFQNYWRKKRTKNEINQEIQARTPSTCGSRRPSVSNLGFLTRPLLQRRLSETLIDINRNTTNGQRQKMKRIASELTWRPISLTFAGLESPILVPRPKEPTTLAHTASCNTLQVPTADPDMISDADRELYNTVRNSFRAAKLNENPRKTIQITIGNNGNSNNNNNNNNLNNSGNSLSSTNKLCNNAGAAIASSTSTLGAANFLLHKVLRLENHNHPHNEHYLKRLTNNSNHSSNYNNCNKKLINNSLYSNYSKRPVFQSCNNGNDNSPLTSPRILITRAFSDESESKTPSLPGTPAKDRRQYSSQTNLVDHVKWHLPDDERFMNIIINAVDDRQSTIVTATGVDQSISGNNNCGDLDNSECESKRMDITSGSNSTTVSELSQRRYSSLDETSGYSRDYEMDSGTEEQLLLSWPTTRKKMKIYCGSGNSTFGRSSNIVSSSGGGGGSSKKALYRPSPLFNDRCEEPEVIL